MPLSIRKFFSAISLLLLLLFYPLAVVEIAANGFGNMSRGAELAFYVIAGLLWIFPARSILRAAQPTPKEKEISESLANKEE